MPVPGATWASDGRRSTPTPPFHHRLPDDARRLRVAWRRARLSMLGGALAGGAVVLAAMAATPAWLDAASVLLLGAGLVVVGATALAAAAWERRHPAAAAFQPTSIQAQPAAASATTISLSAQPSTPASA